MKTITLARAIEQGRYDVAAHLVVIGLVATAKETSANAPKPRRTARQPKRA